MKKRIFAISAIIWALVLVAVGSSTVTILLTGSSFADSRAITDEELEMLERYSRLEEVRKTLMENYYIDVDDETLVQGAIDGMLASLDDPYTFYYTEEDMIERMESSTGEYKGVGMSVQMDGEGAVNVVRVFIDSPAEKAGILSGDKLVAIEGEYLNIQTNKDLEDAVALIRGTVGTEVNLTILRDGEEMEFTVTRGDVNINYVEYEMIGDIGYVRLYEFENSTADSFFEASDYFKAQNARGMVIDLRDNPGGLLTSVVEIADSLLPKGKVIYTEDRIGDMSAYYSDDEKWDIPLVVLINGNSASASEILAASVQDYERGQVIGTTSYGKGIVQLMLTYPDGAGMQYTESRYFTPNGRSIHQVGVEPDIIIEMDDDYDPSIRGVNLENDNQLEEALKILEEEIQKAE
ncbi:MAG: S41 family peptidase [Clostridia bacterium]|nr:S41 family peptidase [Clostridia bacterium]